jgi:hypothetical protein
MNSWCNVSLNFLFSSGIGRMQKVWSMVDQLHWNPHWLSPIILSAYWLNFERTWNRILDDVANSDIATTVSFITLLVNWYNNILFHCWRSSFLCQIELMNLWIPEHNVWSVGVWSVPGNLYLFNFAIEILNSNGLLSGTNDSTVCIYICLTLLILCRLNIWEK